MRISLGILLGAAVVAGCAAPPLGPLVQVLPGPGKSFDQFQIDDQQCRGFANAQVSGQAQLANQQAAGGAVLSTVLGAGLGAIVGGGRGAAVGAATGAGLGVGLGAASSSGAAGGIQAQYDAAYAQCMYSHGDQVPGFAPAYPVGYGPALYAPPIQDRGLVSQTQVELNRLGYLRGAIDGVYGPRTTEAIRAYEAGHGLPADGVTSPALLQQMQATPIGY